jgi:hypothetical protein
MMLPLHLRELEEQPTSHFEGQSVARIARVLDPIIGCRNSLGLSGILSFKSIN